MPNWFYNMETWLALLMIYVICCSIGLLAYFISQKFFKKYDTFEVISKIVWQTVLFFSTMFITFWIATNWHNLKDLSQITKKEANTIESLYSYANLPGSEVYTHKLQNIIFNYLDSIITQEFPALEAGKLENVSLDSYRRLLRFVNQYKSTNTRNNEFAYDRLMRTMDVLLNYRAARLSYSNGELNGPLLGFFIIIIVLGCFWTGAIYSRNFSFSLIIILSQNIIMASSTWLILEIDKPFQGYFKVGDKAFINVKKDILSFDARQG